MDDDVTVCGSRVPVLEDPAGDWRIDSWNTSHG